MAKKTKNVKQEPKEITIKRQFIYHIDNKTFMFFPGEKWQVSGAYPGDPHNKIISNQLYRILKNNKVGG